MKVFEKPSEDQGKQVNGPWASSVFYLLLPSCFLPFHSLRNAIPLAVARPTPHAHTEGAGPSLICAWSAGNLSEVSSQGGHPGPWSASH